MCNHLIVNKLQVKTKILPPQLLGDNALNFSMLSFFCSFTTDTNKTVNMLVTLVALQTM